MHSLRVLSVCCATVWCITLHLVLGVSRKELNSPNIPGKEEPSNTFQGLQQIAPVVALLPWVPPDTKGDRVRFVLKAYGGCYTWATEKPNVVDLHPVYEQKENGSQIKECGNVATVSPAGLSQGRSGRTAVFARDRITGRQLRCEVHVAPLASLTVETPTRSMGVEAYETIGLRGMDWAGNVFSTLEGLWFEWKTERQDVVAFASMNTGIYRSSPTRQMIHQLGGQADVVLLKGMSSGRSRVTVRPSSAFYSKSVPLASVDLDVSEPLAVEPAFIRVPPYARFSYALRIVKPHVMQSEYPIVRLPSHDFVWSVLQRGEGQKVPLAAVRVDRQTAHVEVAGDPSGIKDTVEQAILVVDQRVANNSAEATLIVSPLATMVIYATDVLPVSISVEGGGELDAWEERLHHPAPQAGDWGAALDREPLITAATTTTLAGERSRDAWYLIEGTRYFLGLNAMDRKGDLLYLPVNTRITLGCSSSTVLQDMQKNNTTFSTASTSQPSQNDLKCTAIRLMQATRSKRFAIFDAVQTGGGVLRYAAAIEAMSASSVKGGSVPSVGGAVLQDFYVVKPVRVLLPFADNVDAPVVLPVEHSSMLEAVGGSGHYSWGISNSSVLMMVPNNGAGKVGTLMAAFEGFSEVYVWDTMNRRNRFSFFVVVAPIGRILLDPTTFHVPVGSLVQVPVRAFPARWPERLGRYLERFGKAQEAITAFSAAVERQPYSYHQYRFLEPKKRSMKEVLLQWRDTIHFHFLNCSKLFEPSLKGIQIRASFSTVGIEAVQDNEEPLGVFDHTPEVPFSCGSLRLKAPRVQDVFQIEASFGKGFTARTALQTFFPVTASLKDDDTPWTSPVPSPNIAEWPTPATVASPAFSQSGAVVAGVGTWFDLDLVGGISNTDGFKTAMETRVNDGAHLAGSKIPSKTQFLQVTEKPPSATSNAKGAIRIMCLSVTPAAVVWNVTIEQSSTPVYPFTWYGDGLPPKEPLDVVDAKEVQLPLLYLQRGSSTSVTLHIRCVVPAVIQIHSDQQGGHLARPRETISRIRKPLLRAPEIGATAYYPRLLHARCGVPHRLGLFVFSTEGELVSHWSQAYSLVFERTKAIGTSYEPIQDSAALPRPDFPGVYSYMLSTSECFGTHHLQARLRFSLSHVKERFSSAQQRGINAGALVQMVYGELGHSKRWVRHPQGGRDSGFVLVDHLILVPSYSHILLPFGQRIPSVAEATSSSQRTVVYPFFYKRNWARRLVARLGSGDYTLTCSSAQVELATLGATSREKRLAEEACAYPATPTGHLLNQTHTTGRVASPPLNRITSNEGTVWFSDMILGCMSALPVMDLDEKKQAQDEKSFSNNSFLSVQPQWDIYVRPVTRSVERFTLHLRDTGLLGGTDVQQVYSFSPIGRIHLSRGAASHRFTASGKVLTSPTTPDANLSETSNNDLLHVEVEAVLELKVEVFDQFHGLAFHSRELSLMDLCAELHPAPLANQPAPARLGCVTRSNGVGDVASHISHQDGTTAAQLWSKISEQPHPQDVIYFQGLRSGVYTVRVTGMNEENLQVYSNAVKVVVFEPLRIIPPKVVLLPGGHSFEFTVSGGPNPEQASASRSRSAALRYTLSTATSQGRSGSSSAAVLSVHEAQMGYPHVVTGSKEGSVVLKVEARSAEAPLAVAEAQIIVAEPTQLKVSLGDAGFKPLRQVVLLEGHTQSLVAQLFSASNAPFTFPHLFFPTGHAHNLTTAAGSGPLRGCDFEWIISSSSPGVLLRFLSPFGDTHVSVEPLTTLRGVGRVNIRLHAQRGSHGEGLLSVSVSCGRSGTRSSSGKDSRASSSVTTQIISLPVVVLPNIHRFAHHVFDSTGILLPTSGTIQNGYLDAPTALRLGGYGHYRLVVSEKTHIARVVIAPAVSGQPAAGTASPAPFTAKVACRKQCVDLQVSPEGLTAEWVQSGTPPMQEQSIIAGRLDLTLLLGPPHDEDRSSTSFFRTSFHFGVEVHQPVGLALSPSSSLIGTGSTTQLTIHLLDAQGRRLLIPTHASVTILSTHPSILEPLREKENRSSSTLSVQSLTESAPMSSSLEINSFLLARKRGCSGVSVRLEIPRPGHGVEPFVLVNGLLLCVDASIAPPIPEAFLTIGSSVKLFVDPLHTARKSLVELPLDVWLQPSAVRIALRHIAHCSVTGDTSAAAFLHQRRPEFDDVHSVCHMLSQLGQRKRESTPVLLGDCPIPKEVDVAWPVLRAFMSSTLEAEIESFVRQLGLVAPPGRREGRGSVRALWESGRDVMKDGFESRTCSDLGINILDFRYRFLLAWETGGPSDGQNVRAEASDIATTTTLPWSSASAINILELLRAHAASLSSSGKLLRYVDWGMAGGITVAADELLRRTPIVGTWKATSLQDSSSEPAVATVHPRLGTVLARNYGMADVSLKQDNISGTIHIQVLPINKMCATLIKEDVSTRGNRPSVNVIGAVELDGGTHCAGNVAVSTTGSSYLVDNVAVRPPDLSESGTLDQSRPDLLVALTPRVETADLLSIPLVSSAFISHNLQASCALDGHFLPQFFDVLTTMAPVQFESGTTKSLSGAVSVTVACRLRPRRPRFETVIRYDDSQHAVPHRLRLGVNLSGRAVSNHPATPETPSNDGSKNDSSDTRYQIGYYVFDWSWSPPLVPDYETVAAFRKRSSLPAELDDLVTASSSTLIGSTHALMISKRSRFPLLFRVYTGGRPLRALLGQSELNKWVSVSVAPITQLSDNKTATVSLVWKEAVAWQAAQSRLSASRTSLNSLSDSRALSKSGVFSTLLSAIRLHYFWQHFASSDISLWWSRVRSLLSLARRPLAFYSQKPSTPRDSTQNYYPHHQRHSSHHPVQGSEREEDSLAFSFHANEIPATPDEIPFSSMLPRSITSLVLENEADRIVLPLIFTNLLQKGEYSKALSSSQQSFLSPLAFASFLQQLNNRATDGRLDETNGNRVPPYQKSYSGVSSQIVQPVLATFGLSVLIIVATSLFFSWNKKTSEAVDSPFSVNQRRRSSVAPRPDFIPAQYRRGSEMTSVVPPSFRGLSTGDDPNRTSLSGGDVAVDDSGPPLRFSAGGALSPQRNEAFRGSNTSDTLADNRRRVCHTFRNPEAIRSSFGSTPRPVELPYY